MSLAATEVQVVSRVTETFEAHPVSPYFSSGLILGVTIHPLAGRFKGRTINNRTIRNRTIDNGTISDGMSEERWIVMVVRVPGDHCGMHGFSNRPAL